MNDNNWTPPLLESDEDFLLLKQPLSDRDYIKLKHSLFTEGCKEHILVWHGIIIDGNKRYEICKENNIRFKIRHSMFRSKAEAFVYICKEELQRNDLINEMYKYLIGRLYQSELERKAQMYSSKNESTHPYIPGRVYRKQEISQQISDELKISRGTVLKYEIFTKCIDSLREKEPEIAAKILSGKLKISHENIIELERLPSRELHALNNTLSKSNIDHITYSDFRHELLWKSLPSIPMPPTRQQEDDSLPIRQMPAYDPDSDLANLIFTIPTWVSSIKRAHNNTDFSKATSGAKDKVSIQLSLLQNAILDMQASLKEEYQHE